MNTLDEARTLESQLVAWRRDFHRHPEIGLQEQRTARIVAATLCELGYAVQEGIAHTGVVGLLENGNGPVIMVRADMDALPIQEENDVPYASEIPGMMHACGHDANTAIGLGLATLMARNRETWRGTLKMVFQPGEEGQNGAQLMIEAGVLENPRPERVLALHVWSDLPCGVAGATPGPVMAAAEAWEATITGKGGHAAHPEDTVDPIVVAATIITALQTIVSRNVGAQETAVITVGMIHSGDAFNVIPDEARLAGTVRSYDPRVREILLRRLREVLEGTARVMGATAVLKMYPVTPALVNDAATTGVVQDAIRETLGAEALHVGLRSMGGEDAAFFLNEVPGCYFFIGSTPPGQEKVPHHNPRFDIDEQALPIGVAIMAETLRRLMPPGES
ncbi:MAG: amidohydrolase [Chloroflexi bacterium]|nr:MAG: amidohydrolase [Chloroflexota bacterium]